MDNQEKVTKEMILGDVVMRHPESAPIMLEYGLHCVGCFANQFDTVEQGALLHGMDDAELDEMIARVNEAISKAARTQVTSNKQAANPNYKETTI